MFALEHLRKLVYRFLELESGESEVSKEILENIVSILSIDTTHHQIFIDELLRQGTEALLLHRLRLLDIIDYLARYKENTELAEMWRTIAGKKLYSLVLKIVSRTAFGMSNAPKTRTMMQRWLDDQLFPKSQLQNALQYLKSCESGAMTPPVLEAAHPPAHIIKVVKTSQIDVLDMSAEKRCLSHVDPDDAKEFMEAERSSQKLKRQKALLRPEQEDSDAEFNEFWEISSKAENAREFHIGAGFADARVETRYVNNVAKNVAKHFVYIWDLNLLTLVNHMVAEKEIPVNVDSSQIKLLGRELVGILMLIAEEYGAMSKLKNLKFPLLGKSLQSFIEMLEIPVSSEDQINASIVSIEMLRNLYDAGWIQFYSDLGEAKSIALKQLIERVDQLTQGWITLARNSVETASFSSTGSNAVISSDNISMALSKLLVFQLSDFFDLDSIFCTNGVTKVDIAKHLVSVYGKACTYVFVGLDSERDSMKQLLSAELGVSTSFRKISSLDDLRRFKNILEGLL